MGTQIYRETYGDIDMEETLMGNIVCVQIKKWLMPPPGSGGDSDNDEGRGPLEMKTLLKEIEVVSGEESGEGHPAFRRPESGKAEGTKTNLSLRRLKCRRQWKEKRRG